MVLQAKKPKHLNFLLLSQPSSWSRVLGKEEVVVVKEVKL